MLMKSVGVEFHALQSCMEQCSFARQTLKQTADASSTDVFSTTYIKVSLQKYQRLSFASYRRQRGYVLPGVFLSVSGITQKVVGEF